MRAHQTGINRLLTTLCLAIILGNVATAVTPVISNPALTGPNWPAWRGNGLGISGETGIPLSWDTKINIAWRTPLPGEGSSSPIVWGKRVFVTAALDGGLKRAVICLDAASGRVLWQKEFDADTKTKTDPKAGYAPTTPVTDGQRVYAFFDSPGLIALDMDGNLQWTVPLGPFDTPYNIAASPILYKDTVIMCCDHNKDAFVVALNCADGQVRWKTPRKQSLQYGTPLLIEPKGGAQLILTGDIVRAYNPDTGRELWSCGKLNPTVSPSPIYGNGLVIATSGRNGPALAIDPSGRGDITTTHVKMYVPIGGPYVVSPLFCETRILLPGDDGNMRLLNTQGKQIANLRLRDHFTSSPVFIGKRIYWAADNGSTYVITADAYASDAPHLRVESINRLGEITLASPAIAGEKLYLRTAKALYCIAGKNSIANTGDITIAKSFAELKKQYDDHPDPLAEEDILARIAVMEALGQRQEPEAIQFLKTAAVKDAHWDVSEAAAKALAAQDGPEATAALLEMFGQWRPYLKAIAAEGLARQGAVDAVPVLVKECNNGDPIVRIACLEALSGIAKAKPDQAPTALPLLTAAMTDADVTVRAAAIRSLAPLANLAGDQRETIVADLLDAAADVSPLLSSAAHDMLLAYNVPKEKIAKAMTDRMLYGESRDKAVVKNLTAGPIRVKFQDGELRYLYVGNKEIIRRVYFAVRDKVFDTVMPEFSTIDVQEANGGFTVKLAAICKGPTADYSWTGEIAGTKDGVITFHVQGQPNKSFVTPRIGLCILFGSDSLNGQTFIGVDKDGKEYQKVFPKDVSPSLLTDVNFNAVRYTTADGVQVALNMTGNGFGIEDQRNFGDTSYKAYHSLAYKPYTDLTKGEMHEDTLTISVKGAKPAAVTPAPIRVTLGGPLKGTKMPKIVPPGEKPAEGFSGINGKRDKLKDVASLAWSYNVAMHMPDDDMFMENLPTIIDHARTVRTFTPAGIPLRIDPAGFDAPYPRTRRDPRNFALFGAAWTAAFAGYAGQAGINELAFTTGPGPADIVRQWLEAAVGKEMLSAAVTGPQPAPVTAFANRDGKSSVLWLVNTTATSQQVTIAKVPKGNGVVNRLTADAVASGQISDLKIIVQSDVLPVTLAPYETYKITVTPK